MSNQVIFWDEMKPGYRTSQASAAGRGGGGGVGVGAPRLPTLRSRRHALAESDHTQAGGSEVLNAGARGDPKRNETKKRVRVVKQPFPP